VQRALDHEAKLLKLSFSLEEKNKRKLRLVNPNFINFVEPKSVAIVGASTTPGKLGYVVVENLFNIGYKGKIYPVNPKGGELLGLKIFENVKKIPEVVDVAHVLIPAAAVLGVVKDLAEMGVKNVVISSGGFTEVDEEGAKMQDEIVKTAKEAGMRIIGPNTTGVISAPANFSTTFTNVDELRVGGASYVAQTGNFGSVTLTWIMTKEHFGISRVIGLGNKCDIDDADALEFLGEDTKTKVIGMYIEGLKDGRRFIEAGKKAVKKKPVLVLKSGRTEAGAKAAASHTASLAADDSIVDSALRQSGVIRVDNYGDLINYAKAFIFQPPPKGNRVGVITPSGGLGVVTSDALETRGLKVATLSENTIKKFEEISPPIIEVRNPFDIWPAVSNHGLEKCYECGLKGMLEDPNVDAVLMGLMLAKGWDLENIDPLIDTLMKHPNKPVISYGSGDWQLTEKLKTKFEKHKKVRIPMYEFPEQASDVISAMYKYTDSVNRIKS